MQRSSILEMEAAALLKHRMIYELQQDHSLSLSLGRTDSSTVCQCNGDVCVRDSPYQNFFMMRWSHLCKGIWEVTNSIECRHTWLLCGRLHLKGRVQPLDGKTRNYYGSLLNFPQNLMDLIITMAYTVPKRKLIKRWVICDLLFAICYLLFANKFTINDILDIPLPVNLMYLNFLATMLRIFLFLFL